MRKKVSGFVTVRAVSGTHVAFLALDVKESDAKGLMGFAIQRTDLIEDETIRLRGNKTFASIRPVTGIEDGSSHEHPFRALHWADYAWVDTKLIFITSLGIKPVTLMGCANFSEASMDTNQENMVLIRGGTRSRKSGAFNTGKPLDLFEGWKQ